MGGEGQRSECGNQVRLDLLVPATPRILPEVRRALGELALPASVLDDARLLVSELVTNSIRHAGLHSEDQIRIGAQLSRGRLRVDVFDRADPNESHAVAGYIRPPPGSQSGWGLYLVDRLSSRWGRGRGRYWFELQFGRREESPEA